MQKRSPLLYLLLLPITLIYGSIVSLRNRLFDSKILPSQEFDIPIISVGNITVGGTGKTPHIEYLVSLLKDQFNIATLSRGYKRKTKKFLVATPESTVNDIGDEPKQIKQKFPDITVAVDRKRVNGINSLLSDEIEPTFDAILLDDAYQHRYVKPGLSILLIDYNRPIHKDHLLPYGRLREQCWGKRRAHIIIITKTPKNLKPIERRIREKELNAYPYQSLYFTTFKYGKITPLFKSDTEQEVTLEDNSTLLVTGIANPKPLKEHIMEHSNEVQELQFEDHHDFTSKDLQKIADAFSKIGSQNKIIITTEKDAMRLQEHPNIDIIKHLPIYYIPIEIDFLFEGEEQFNSQIVDYVKKNKRNSFLHL